MTQKTYCPNCYKEFQECPANCDNCNYPFNGTEREKYEFMSAINKDRNTIEEASNYESYSRWILFIIGGINLIIAIILLISSYNNLITIPTIVTSTFIIILGFYSYKDPFFALLLGFISLIFMYAIYGLFDPVKLFSGMILKIFFVSGFIYGLVKIRQSEKTIKGKIKKL
jgi:hypothetical protein